MCAHEWIDSRIGSRCQSYIQIKQHDVVDVGRSSNASVLTKCGEIIIKNSQHDFCDGHCRRRRRRHSRNSFCFGIERPRPTFLMENKNCNDQQSMQAPMHAPAHMKTEWVILNNGMKRIIIVHLLLLFGLLLWWSIIACKYVRSRISMEEKWEKTYSEHWTKKERPK